MQRLVKPGPALLVDLALQTGADLQFRAWAKPYGREFGRALPHAMADIVARDDEIATRVILAAEHDVRMRVIRIPMVDRDPFELGSKIGFHPLQEITGEPLQVAQFRRIVGSNDKAKLVPIFTSTCFELLQVGDIGQGTVGLRRLAVAGNSIAGDLAQMGCNRVGAGRPEPNEPRFEHHAA